MSKVIDLLERIGSMGTGSEAIETILSSARSEASVPDDQLEAIVSANHQQLHKLLGASATVFCAVFPAKQDEDEQEDKEPDEDKDAPEEKSMSTSTERHRRLAIAS